MFRSEPISSCFALEPDGRSTLRLCVYAAQLRPRHRWIRYFAFYIGPVVWVGPTIVIWHGLGLPLEYGMGWACLYYIIMYAVFGAFVADGLLCSRSVMSRPGECTALPSEVSQPDDNGRCSGRSSRDREWLSARSESLCSGGSASPSPQRSYDHRRTRRSLSPAGPSHLTVPLQVHANAHGPYTRANVPEPSWRLVLDELTALRGEVEKLKAVPPTSSQPEVYAQPGPSHAPGVAQQAASPANFSGFGDSGSEDGELREVTPRKSVLLQGVKDLGPPESVSADIDQQVAGMVNFLFDNGMQEEDYKAITEDVIARRPSNCPALAPVDCNSQILGALKTDAKRADGRLRDVSADILKAGTILTKSLLILDKVAQEEDNPVVAQEVGLLNGVLALLGHANHRTNLARRFIMRREINPKYSHLCTDKVPMSRYLFGDDVSQTAKQIDDTEKLKNKFSAKKSSSQWKFTSGRSRGFWGRTTHRNYSARFQPYGLQRFGYRGGQRQPSVRQDLDSKNARGRGHSRPRH